jgi:glycine/D-amino acid oxidase-like deaminating enzyme
MTRFTARRTPVHKGTAAWSAILPGQPAPVPLPGDRTVDVAIIGGGFAGLAAARRLRQLDQTLKVAVLEASRLAEGASGRNSGFMIDLAHELTSDDYVGQGDARGMIALNRHAIVFARGAVEDYGINPNYFDPVVKVNGATSDTADALNRSYAEHLSSPGEPNQRLDAEGMFQLTGSRHYVTGLYTPGTVMLQPAGFVRGFDEGLRAGGVGIWEQTPVTAFAREMEPGLYAATVCNGLGTTRSTLTGLCAAELELDLTTDTTRHFAAEDEAVKLPPKPFSTLGANLFPRFKEWRAGRE